MSSFFCRTFYRLLRNPSRVIWAFLALTLVSLAPIYILQVKTSLLDLFDRSTPARIQAEHFQDEVGGIGHLAIVLRGNNPDSIRDKAIEVETKLNLRNDLAYIERIPKQKALSSHRWFFINPTDLDSIYDKLQSIRIRVDNPLISDLITENDTAFLPRILERYEWQNQDWLGAPDGHIQIINVFPKNDATDPKSNETLYKSISSTCDSILSKSPIELGYSGSVYKSVRTEAHLVKDLKQVSFYSAIALIVLLLLVFYRMPFFPILALVPILTATAWTIGLWSLFVGEIHIFVLLLAPLALSMGTDTAIHIMSRYEEERRKGLSGLLSLETVLLETGPSLCRSNWTTALAFFCLAFIPFPGIRDFGLIAGILLLSIWLHTLLFFPALMILSQKWKLLKIHGAKLHNLVLFERKPNPSWKIPLVFGGIICFSLLPYAAHPFFDRNLSQTKLELSWADSSTLKWGQNLDEPAIIRTNTLSDLEKIETQLRTRFKTDSNTVKSIYSTLQLIPSHQKEKQQKLLEIQALINDEVIELLPPELRIHAKDLQNANLADTLEFKSLPLSLQRQFRASPNSSNAYYLYITPNLSIFNLDALRHFARENNKFELDSGKVIYATGSPILLSNYISQTMPYVDKAFWFLFAGIVLLLLLEYRDPVYLLMILLPAGLGALLITGVLRFVETPFHAFNIYLVPLYLGYSIDASLLLLNRYLEEGRGSLPFVLRRTMPSLLKSSLISSACFATFFTSDSELLQGVAIIGIAATISSLSAALLIQPLLLSLVDRLRWKTYLKAKRSAL